MFNVFKPTNVSLLMLVICLNTNSILVWFLNDGCHISNYFLFKTIPFKEPFENRNRTIKNKNTRAFDKIISI